MEMMHMMMDKQLLDDDDLPQQIQIPLPFQHLISDSSPLMEFSGGSTTSNQPTPSPQSHMIYPPPPLIMQFSPLQFRTSTLPRGAGGSSWFQQMKPPVVDSSVEAMREMIFRMAALQPVQIDPESIKPPKRRNVKISKDPQSVAARHRRERISERIRILQRLVPGGTKMDTASMLDEAAHYMKFLKNQVQSLEQAAAASATMPTKTSPAPPPVVGCCTTTMNNNIHGTNNNSHLIRACGLQPAAATQASHVLARLSCGDA